MLTASPRPFCSPGNNARVYAFAHLVWVGLISLPGVARRIRTATWPCRRIQDRHIQRLSSHHQYFMPSQPTLPVDNLLPKWLNLKTMPTLLQTCLLFLPSASASVLLLFERFFLPHLNCLQNSIVLVRLGQASLQSQLLWRLRQEDFNPRSVCPT